MKGNDQMTRDDRRDEDVELGEEVKVRRRGGTALVAVRLSTELLGRVQAYAKASGLTVSEVLRMGAESIAYYGATTASTQTVRSLVSSMPAETAGDFTTSVERIELAAST